MNTFKEICTLLVFIAGAKIEATKKIQIRNILHGYGHSSGEEKLVNNSNVNEMSTSYF